MIPARLIILAMAAVAAISAGAFMGPNSDRTLPPGPVAGEQIEGFERVLITPANARGEKKLRGRADVDVRHEFDGQFSANVPSAVIPTLEKFGTVELVPVYTVDQRKVETNAKPVCGNGIAEGGEKCGEPGLSCGAGQACSSCKCKAAAEEPPVEDPPGRSCLPENQREYNVVQVNGGSLTDGTGVNVAVLDTGAMKDHLDLDVKVCKDATKRKISGGCEDRSSVAHGTHSSGITSAYGGDDGLGLLGVAPGSNLWAIKVCGDRSCFTDDIAAAIRYAANQGVHIINMSFGGSVESSLIRNAIAAHPEVLFVASSGNSGPNANTIGYPGANPNVIAVAANDSGKVVARFSSRGIDDGNDATIVEREVELIAGGVSVESTNSNGCYSKLSGTSFSAPTVAGLAAKVWQGSAATTRAYLISIAQDVTQSNGGGAEAGFDTASGYGLPVAP